MISRASGLKRLTRSVGRKKYSSIARAGLKQKVLRNHVIKALSTEIQKEFSVMCSCKTASLFRDKSRDGFSRFTWNAVSNELQKHASIFFSILSGCVAVKRRVKKSVKKHNKNCPNSTAIIGVCATILLRNKNSHMNLFQHIMSIILHAGHASKQVI